MVAYCYTELSRHCERGDPVCPRSLHCERGNPVCLPFSSLRTRRSGNHPACVIASGAKQSRLIILPYKNIYMMIQKLYWIASVFPSLAMTEKDITRSSLLSSRTHIKLSCRTCFKHLFFLSHRTHVQVSPPPPNKLSCRTCFKYLMQFAN